MTAAAQAPAFTAPAGLRNLARQSADSVAAAVKIISDLTAQEMALMVGILRERVSMRRAAAAAETAGRVATSFADAGKILLDLAANETAVMTDGLKEALRLRPGVAAMVDLVPRGVGTIVDMEKRYLDAVSGQFQDVIESFTEDKPLMLRSRIAKMAQQSLEGFIEIQKTFLDEVSEQVTIATEAPKESKAAKHERAKVLIDLAREGVDKFITAQKEVAELAMDRAEAETVGVRTKPEPHTSLAELTRKSVQNFTTAQKSLLDLALNPIAEAAEPEKRHRAPRKATKAKARARAKAPRKRKAAAAEEATA